MYDKLVCISAISDEPDPWENVDQLRRRVRLDRHGFWFPLVVFGGLTLLATPLYWSYPLHWRDMHCHFVGTNLQSCSGIGGTGFGALTPGYAASGLGPWISNYWIVALVVGYALTVWFFRRRARRVGLAQRVAPAVIVGIGVLALAILANELWRVGVTTFSIDGDFWVRGTASLVILSFGLLVLALLERSVGYVLFSVGFVGVALLASLYNLANLFAGTGWTALVDGNGAALANVILPGLYLLLGGIVCWALQHDGRRRGHEVGVE